MGKTVRDSPQEEGAGHAIHTATWGSASIGQKAEGAGGHGQDPFFVVSRGRKGNTGRAGSGLAGLNSFRGSGVQGLPWVVCCLCWVIRGL